MPQRGGHDSRKMSKTMVMPITLIYRFLQSQTRLQVLLFDNKNIRIEGIVIGFDEFMNLVLDDAFELLMKERVRKPLGRILLKGENVMLIMSA